MAIELTHTRSCPALTPNTDDACTCGLEWRIQLQTEREMHNAWRKRAEEAEAEKEKWYEVQRSQNADKWSREGY